MIFLQNFQVHMIKINHGILKLKKMNFNKINIHMFVNNYKSLKIANNIIKYWI